MTGRRAVITGVGAITPLGVGTGPLIDRWLAGEHGLDGGEGVCRDFEPEEHLSTKVVRRSDRYTQFALAASDQAIADAGWADGAPYEAERIGCVVSSGIGGLISLEWQIGVLHDQGPKALSPLGIPLLMPNAAAGQVAMRHGLEGQAYGIVSACAASGNAIGQSLRLIQYGEVDAVVAGGAEATLTPLARGCFASMKALSPTGESRPFDLRRDGFVMGEGAGMLVIEEREAALERGAKILGEIAGYASTADAFHLTAPEPSGRAAARAISLALKDANLEPGDLDYVNAHGTSTPLNDAAETRALKTALGDEAYEVPISSTKSVIGHLLGAAGAVEAIATAAALERRLIPPTVGYEQPDPELDLDYVPDGPREMSTNGHAPVAISNSFGFGGHNVVLVIKGAEPS
jgi:3-oxoacyl-[acyl-carrier-protein] synthase II